MKVRLAKYARYRKLKLRSACNVLFVLAFVLIASNISGVEARSGDAAGGNNVSTLPPALNPINAFPGASPQPTVNAPADTVMDSAPAPLNVKDLVPSLNAKTVVKTPDTTFSIPTSGNAGAMIIDENSGIVIINEATESISHEIAPQAKESAKSLALDAENIVSALTAKSTDSTYLDLSLDQLTQIAVR